MIHKPPLRNRRCAQNKRGCKHVTSSHYAITPHGATRRWGMGRHDNTHPFVLLYLFGSIFDQFICITHGVEFALSRLAIAKMSQHEYLSSRVPANQSSFARSSSSARSPPFPSAGLNHIASTPCCCATSIFLRSSSISTVCAPLICSPVFCICSFQTECK